jgi:xanthosine utilization system XapX-like protein
MVHDGNNDTGTTIIGLLGILITQQAVNWVAFIGGIITSIWVLYQLISRVREDLEKRREKRKLKSSEKK